jgi:hypothetical protein
MRSSLGCVKLVIDWLHAASLVETRAKWAASGQLVYGDLRVIGIPLSDCQGGFAVRMYCFVARMA